MIWIGLAVGALVGGAAGTFFTALATGRRR